MLLVAFATFSAATRSFGRCPDGGTPSPEICNGIDDDCNGVVDDPFEDGSPPICPTGKYCVTSAFGPECLAHCRYGDFLCAPRQVCIRLPLTGSPQTLVRTCVATACFRTANPCDAGYKCESQSDSSTFTCAPTCTITGCPTGSQCVAGTCVAEHPDGGDASATPLDSGASGSRRDAGNGRSIDSNVRGREGATSAGACGCRAARQEPSAAVALAVAVAALLGGLRRRRGARASAIEPHP